MSAASQAREKAARQKLMLKRYADLPEPGHPPEPEDPEFERQLAWFVQNHDDIAKTLGVQKIIIDVDYPSPILIPLPAEPGRVTPVLTIRRSAENVPQTSH